VVAVMATNEYTKKDLLRVLYRNLDAEFRAIKFYLENLPKLNYKKNKAALDVLLFESYDHARMLSEEIILLEQSSGKLTEQMRTKALAEETSLKAIYTYELLRTKDAKAIAMLRKLIREEAKHEALVKRLK